MTRRSLLALVFLGLAALACEDGPTGPKEDILFQGTLRTATNESFFFTVPETGLVRFTLQELTFEADDPEFVAPSEGLSLGFGLGRPNEETCQTSATLALVVGETGAGDASVPKTALGSPISHRSPPASWPSRSPSAVWSTAGRSRMQSSRAMQCAKTRSTPG